MYALIIIFITMQPFTQYGNNTCTSVEIEPALKSDYLSLNFCPPQSIVGFSNLFIMSRYQKMNALVLLIK